MPIGLKKSISRYKQLSAIKEKIARLKALIGPDWKKALKEGSLALQVGHEAWKLKREIDEDLKRLPPEQPEAPSRPVGILDRIRKATTVHELDEALFAVIGCKKMSPGTLRKIRRAHTKRKAELIRPA